MMLIYLFIFIVVSVHLGAGPAGHVVATPGGFLKSFRRCSLR